MEPEPVPLVASGGLCAPATPFYGLAVEIAKKEFLAKLADLETKADELGNRVAALTPPEPTA